MDNEAIFTQEMNQMIRSIVEMSVNNGYKIQDVKEAISKFYQEYTKRMVYTHSELEEKLYQMFYLKLPRWKNSEKFERYLKEMAIVCGTYFQLRQDNTNFKIKDFASIVAPRLNIQLSTTVARMHGYALRLHIYFCNGNLGDYVRTMDVLENFYEQYMKNLI